MYLDHGFAVARDVVLGCLRDRIAEAAAGPGGRDYKTRLQEIDRGARRSAGPATSCATRAPTTPSTSSRRCTSATTSYGEGEGRSKKQAEQAAAWVAWTRLQEEAGEQGDDDAGAA